MVLLGLGYFIYIREGEYEKKTLMMYVQAAFQLLRVILGSTSSPAISKLDK
jgi:hypothetical protein